MNLMIIGNSVDDIAMDIWKANTNYAVLNQSPYVWSKQFLKYIDAKPVIVATTSEQFIEKDIDVVLEFMQKHNFIPIFIADDRKAIENNMYSALEEGIPSTLLYIKNKANKDYNELIKISQGYLLGKGIIKSDDKTVRTSRKRKKPAVKK